ncbi:MAG: hypothetical protein UU92_C0026G0010 [candidate division WWE3 bacterium GW2011_GWA1_42_12]|nr:MAG: hypothetical protein UU92_C0026G0010 [candidate division WWE3 bacterium GW2011_GWA1_42_12]
MESFTTVAAIIYPVLLSTKKRFSINVCMADTAAARIKISRSLTEPENFSPKIVVIKSSEPVIARAAKAIIAPAINAVSW